MPDMKVTIKIAGLAYCHLANKQAGGIADLQALFLYADKRHNLKLRITKFKTQGGYETSQDIPDGTSIQLTASGAVSVPREQAVEPGQPITDMVDIDLLHSHPSPTATVRLPLKRSDMKLSYLSIPGVICYTAKKTEDDFEFWKIFTAGLPPTLNKTLEKRQPIGLQLGVELHVNVGGEVNLELSGKIKSSYEFNYEENCRYEILFNNDCPDSTCQSDFRYYYKILESGGVEFEELLPFPHFADHDDADTEAACNPTIGDPPGCKPDLYFRGRCP